MTQEKRKTKRVKYRSEVEERIAEAIREGKPLSGKEGILTPIIKRALETALEGGVDQHLEETKKEGNNRKNGKGSDPERSDQSHLKKRDNFLL